MYLTKNYNVYMKQTDAQKMEKSVATQNRKSPRLLDDKEFANEKIELTHPNILFFLKSHKPSTTVVYQQTWAVDSKDLRRFKKITTKTQLLKINSIYGPNEKRKLRWFAKDKRR